MFRNYLPTLYMPDQKPDNDPRKRTRTVPMRVICLGLSRTGTTFMAEALELLGFGPVYMAFTTFSNSGDAEMLLESMRRSTVTGKEGRAGAPFGRKEFDQLFGRHSSITAMAAYTNAAELVAAYPEAKFILTHRDIGSWAKSIEDMFETATEYSSWTPRLWSLLDPPNASVQPLVWQMRAHFGYPYPFKHNPAEFYNNHYTRMRDLVPAGKLLEYKVQEGWGPLCEFLEVPVPQATPFPKSNTVGDFRSRFKARRSRLVGVRWRRLALLVGVVMVAGGAWIVNR